MILKATKSGFFDLQIVTVFLGELLGTVLLVFLGCSGCIQWTDHQPNPLQVSLSFGFVILICIQIFGCVSMAHLNPAVTLAAVVYKIIDKKVST